MTKENIMLELLAEQLEQLSLEDRLELAGYLFPSGEVQHDDSKDNQVVIYTGIFEKPDGTYTEL